MTSMAAPFLMIFALLVALMQAPHSLGANSVAQLGNTLQEIGAQAAVRRAPPPMQTIPLQKQYVPVVRGNQTIAFKTAYFGELHIGAPKKQAFTVVFDTGSGHLIVPSTLCETETCEKHRRYDRTLSPDATDIEYDGTPVEASAIERDQVAISFGTGQVEGQFVRDRVCLGSGGMSEGACTDLRVVVATEMSPEPFGLFAFDGVLGLGLDSLALNPEFNFFKQLAAQNPGFLPRFAFFLAEREGDESIVSFGGHDEARAESEVQWVSVARPELGYWQVRIRRIRIGHTLLEDCADGSCHAIIDTGSSMLGVPRRAVRPMQRLLARPVPRDISARPSEVDCRNVPGAELHFDLAGGSSVTVSLGPAQLARPAPINMTVPDADGRGLEASQLFCRSLLLPVDIKEPLGPLVFILGEPMLRKYYTVYDLGEQQIGFSTARQSSSPLSSGMSRSVGTPALSDALVSGAPLPA